MTIQYATPKASDAGTVQLGDLIVNRLGFGAMQLSGPGVWGEPDDPANARAVLKRALDLGVNLIDTADYYGPLVSNRLILEALYPYPGDLVIATKVGAKRGKDRSWQHESDPASMKAACESNLRHLRLDRLDLVHFRYFNGGNVPMAESLGALADLQREGKIRNIGISNVTLSQLAAAQKVVNIVSVENLYNISDRHSDEVVDACTAQRIVFMPYFPLAVGRLSQPDSPLAAFAQTLGATPSQVALAWLLGRSPIMLPIPGTASLSHLEENIGASQLKLPDNVERRLLA